MSCFRCSHIEHSHKEKPFCAPGYKNTYVCENCGQRWWCHNDFLCLWSMIGADDNLTWESVKRGCPIPVGIGKTSKIIGWSKCDFVMPQHPVCEYETEVDYPRISMEKVGANETLVVQWSGDYRNNIFGFQFKFPLMVNPEVCEDAMRDSFIIVAYIGEAKEWPLLSKPTAAELVDRLGTDACVAYLLSPPRKKSPRGISILVDVALIGDSNVGVIKPSRFFDPGTVEMHAHALSEIENNYH